jgi:hypothetical protein
MHTLTIQAVRQDAPAETFKEIAMRASELEQWVWEVRLDRYGAHGGSMLAVGFPGETCANFAAGVAMSGVILLRFLKLAEACPRWLPTGNPPRYSHLRRF